MLGKLVGTGRTAEVHEWTKDTVVKLFYPHLPYAQISDEFDKHQLIAENSAFGTRPHSIESMNGRYGIVYARVAGTSMIQRLTEGSEKAYDLGRKLGQIHAEIHKVRIPQLEAMKPSFEHRIRSSKEISEADKPQLLQLLSELPEDDVLCHLDFHPENVFLEGERATVLDWMTALKGDPLADIARTLMILRYAEIPHVSEEERKNIEVKRNELLEGYEKSYVDTHAFDRKRLDRWMTIMAALRLSEDISVQERKRMRDVLETRLRGCT